MIRQPPGEPCSFHTVSSPFQRGKSSAFLGGRAVLESDCGSSGRPACSSDTVGFWDSRAHFCVPKANGNKSVYVRSACCPMAAPHAVYLGSQERLDRNIRSKDSLAVLAAIIQSPPSFLLPKGLRPVRSDHAAQNTGARQALAPKQPCPWEVKERGRIGRSALNSI